MHDKVRMWKAAAVPAFNFVPASVCKYWRKEREKVLSGHQTQNGTQNLRNIKHEKPLNPDLR